MYWINVVNDTSTVEIGCSAVEVSQLYVNITLSLRYESLRIAQIIPGTMYQAGISKLSIPIEQVTYLHNVVDEEPIEKVRFINL